MRHDLFLSGFGGQGILMGGQLLAYAGMLEGFNVSYFPAYGVEKRGGAASCTVILGDGEIGSPVVGRPGSVMLLDEASFERYFSRVRPEGFCLVNRNLVAGDRLQRSDLRILELPANDLALECGDQRLVTMVAIGALVGATGLLPMQRLQQALGEVIPERNRRFLPLNQQAIERGFNLAAALVTADPS